MKTNKKGLLKNLEELKESERFSKKINAVYEDGQYLTISEVVSLFRREGFEVTTQQIRKYESKEYSLIVPARKTKSKYRLYDTENIEQVRTILSLRWINIPLKKIKHFFALYYEIDKFVNENTVFPISKNRPIRILGLDKFEISKYEEVEKNLYRIEKKDKGGNNISKEVWDEILIKIDKLLGLTEEFGDRWLRFKDNADKYHEIFNKQSNNLYIIRKRIQMILEGK